MHLLEASIKERYVNSVYWAMTTMTSCGYGDITPITTNERVVNMFTMICSCMIFAFVIGDIGRLVSRINLLAV